MPEEPEAPFPVIFADSFGGAGIKDGLIRLLAAAEAMTSDGAQTASISGMVVMTVPAALKLRSDLDQLLTQLEKLGVIEIPKGPLQS